MFLEVRFLAGLEVLLPFFLLEFPFLALFADREPLPRREVEDFATGVPPLRRDYSISMLQ